MQLLSFLDLFTLILLAEQKAVVSLVEKEKKRVLLVTLGSHGELYVKGDSASFDNLFEHSEDDFEQVTPSNTRKNYVEVQPPKKKKKKTKN